MDLFVTSDNRAHATVVSNTFIDEYMKDANDAQLKVYLYLLRTMSAGISTDITKMADLFNHTERDIVRSLEYWEKKGLLCLEYDKANTICGVRFCSVSDGGTAISVPGTQASPVALKVVPDEEPLSGINENISYSRDQLKAFKNSDETSQIVFVAEQYLKRTLSLADIQALYFIYDELKFTCEMTDYLLQYCLDRGKDSFSYIKKVAINWHQSGITTPKQAKEQASTKFEKYVYTVLKSLGKSSIPQQPEVDIVNKWYKEWSFDLDVIAEACKRTVLATDSHRLEYCDKILSSWKASGVHHTADIAKIDAAYKKGKSKTGTGSANGSFGQFTKNDYDFDALEKALTGQ
ncbi:MAG: DnaD domain protein [Lachnospiraceae bacterium]|nr:DnaD domain protein [Lachnospiraceae bacterium]